jgi:hypothetical protein
VTTRRFFAAVALASLASAPAGCILRDDSGGNAAGGAVAVGGGGQGGGDGDGVDDAGTGSADAGADATPGGRGGEDGGGGEDSGGGGAMHCSALPFGCVCSPTEPSQVGACNTGSVIRASAQRSVCCDNPYRCICVAYECVRVNAASCSCQLAAAKVDGARVGDCADVAAKPTIKCCRSYGQCVCSTTDCLPIETPVASCSVQDLLTCDAGDTGVSACEAAGAAAAPLR